MTVRSELPAPERARPLMVALQADILAPPTTARRAAFRTLAHKALGLWPGSLYPGYQTRRGSSSARR